MAIPRQLRAIHHFISFLSSPITRSPLRAASEQLLRSGFPARNISTTQLCRKEKDISITFVSKDGEKRTGKGKVGDSLYDVMINNGVEFQYIDRSAVNKYFPVCAVCHMTFTKEDYENLPTKPTKNELFILDLAYKNTDTSRLGCVIQLTEAMNGLEVKVPYFLSPVATFTYIGTVIRADFMPSKRDPCRYKCLNAHEPVERNVGKYGNYVIGHLFLLFLAFFCLFTDD